MRVKCDTVNKMRVTQTTFTLKISRKFMNWIVDIYIFFRFIRYSFNEQQVPWSISDASFPSATLMC